MTAGLVFLAWCALSFALVISVGTVREGIRSYVREWRERRRQDRLWAAFTEAYQDVDKRVEERVMREMDDESEW